MKTILILCAFLVSLQISAQSAPISLDAAYKREILFLNGQKRELESRQQEYSRATLKQTKANQLVIDKLESQLRELKNNSQKSQLELLDLEKDLSRIEQDKEGIENLISRAGNEGLTTANSEEKITMIFNSRLEQLKKSNTSYLKKMEILNNEGELVTYQTLSLGDTAHYAFDESGKTTYLLVPAGQGILKIHQEVPYIDFKNKREAVVESMPIFLHESSRNAYEPRKEKSLNDIMQAAGSIGWVIVVLGFVTLIMVFCRAFLLYRNKSLTPVEIKTFLSSPSELKVKNESAFTRILSRLIQSNKKSKEDLEGIASEQLVREWTLIDRFGTLIIVAASAAPLLGLLGTVTGMISTFDIITEFGTGDPKLLSSGISEALITTMLGLIVAIPALIIGSLLSAESEKRKSQMEEMVLFFLNQNQNEEAEC